MIGAPVRRREWVVPHYIKALNEALCESDMTAQLVFVLPGGDPTEEALIDAMQGLSRYGRFEGLDLIYTREAPDPIKERNWGVKRLHLMVDLRNALLGRVRELAPAFFLSLDSDILIAPDALGIALKGLRTYHAIGMRTYMGPPHHGPRDGRELLTSHGQLVNGRLTNRFDYRIGTHPTDVIMAAKLMSQRAYRVDYCFDVQGEDIGWSQACQKAGVSLGFAAEARAKHVMYPEDLDRIDPRVGF